MSYNQNLGRQGEKIAYQYLLDNDYNIIDQNFRSQFGEIDIVAEKNKKLYFIEVKTRANLDKGKPYEAITPRKKHQMKKASQYFLLKNNYKNVKCTLSVVSIIFESSNQYHLQFFESID